MGKGLPILVVLLLLRCFAFPAAYSFEVLEKNHAVNSTLFQSITIHKRSSGIAKDDSGFSAADNTASIDDDDSFSFSFLSANFFRTTVTNTFLSALVPLQNLSLSAYAVLKKYLRLHTIRI